MTGGGIRWGAISEAVAGGTGSVALVPISPLTSHCNTHRTPSHSLCTLLPENPFTIRPPVTETPPHVIARAARHSTHHSGPNSVDICWLSTHSLRQISRAPHCLACHRPICTRPSSPLHRIPLHDKSKFLFPEMKRIKRTSHISLKPATANGPPLASSCSPQRHHKTCLPYIWIRDDPPFQSAKNWGPVPATSILRSEI